MVHRKGLIGKNIGSRFTILASAYSEFYDCVGLRSGWVKNSAKIFESGGEEKRYAKDVFLLYRGTEQRCGWAVDHTQFASRDIVRHRRLLSTIQLLLCGSRTLWLSAYERNFKHAALT